MVTLRVGGAEKIISAIESIDREISKGDFIAEATEYAFERSKKHISKHNDTGKMEDSLTHMVRRASLTGRVYFSPDVPYAAFVHFGTRPHTIKPQKRKVLRWSGPDGFAFAKRVQHPGYKGDPFFENAANETFRQLDKITERIIDGAL